MSRTLFENSKAALAFAGMTIVGTVLMVGSADQGGVLDRAASRLSEEPAVVAEAAPVITEVQSEPETEVDPSAGWGGGGSMFGDYDPQAEAAANSAPVISPAMGDKRAARPVQETARIPGPQPVVPDYEGIPVPGPE